MIRRAWSPLIIRLRGRRTEIGRNGGRNVWHWITFEIGKPPSSPGGRIERVVGCFSVVPGCRVVTVTVTVSISITVVTE
jgi:hypothetical protein